jgi:hypothetical protein
MRMHNGHTGAEDAPCPIILARRMLFQRNFFFKSKFIAARHTVPPPFLLNRKNVRKILITYFTILD